MSFLSETLCEVRWLAKGSLKIGHGLVEMVFCRSSPAVRIHRMVNTAASRRPHSVSLRPLGTILALVQRRQLGAQLHRILHRDFPFDITGLDDGGTSRPVFRRPSEFLILPGLRPAPPVPGHAAAASSPVPVPSVRWIDPGGDAWGTLYLVMDRIDGVVGVSDVPAYHGAGIFSDTDDRAAVLPCGTVAST